MSEAINNIKLKVFFFVGFIRFIFSYCYKIKFEQKKEIETVWCLLNYRLYKQVECYVLGALGEFIPTKKNNIKKAWKIL